MRQLKKPMSSSGNAGGKKIACNLVEHINLASRAVLETALQTDDQVDKTIAFDMDLNLLMKNIPLPRTGNRSLSKYFAFSKNAKDQIDRALESTPEKPGSSLPYASLSDWQTFVVEGDELDAGSIFTTDNKSGDAEPFSKIIEQEILEMRTLQNSGHDTKHHQDGGEGNTQIIEGVVPKWLDEKGGVIPGNVDTNGTPHKNFLHSFLSSSQLDELVRSSVELSLYCTPQPNEMISGGEDTSDASVAKAHDSLNNRDDFGKVFPQPTSADERWTSFLKLREDDLWIFKLRLSIHDDELSAGGPSSSRLYRFIFRQKDTVPDGITMSYVEEVKEENGAVAYPQHFNFTLQAPLEAPARNEIEYTGSLTHLGVQVTQSSDTDPTQYLVDPNSMFHTGEKLSSGGLEDGFLCALVPASQDACVNLTRPIFAVAQAAIKKVDDVGTITQLHPIRDLDAQVSRYVDHDRCLVMPMKEWNAKKNPAVLGQSSIKELFDDGEEYRKYPTCHVRVQCGSGVKFDLQFEADSQVDDDPNSGELTAVRLTGVKLVDGGSGYITQTIEYDNTHDFYTFYLKGSSGEYMPHQVVSNDIGVSFHGFMMEQFSVNGDGAWDYRFSQAPGSDGVIPYPDNRRRIMAADESEMSVELRQGDRVCSFTSMSEAIQLPLFHNQDVQGDGDASKLEDTSFSVYSHTFQNNDPDRTKTLQPIQQNMASKLEIQYPPHRFLKDHDTNADRAKVMTTLTDDIKCQYEKINAFVEVGGLSERGGNYHMIEEDSKQNLYRGDDNALAISYTQGIYKGFKQLIFDTGKKSFPITTETIEDAFQNCYINHRYMNSRRLVLKHQFTTGFDSIDIDSEFVAKHPPQVFAQDTTYHEMLEDNGSGYRACVSGHFGQYVSQIFDGNITEGNEHISENCYNSNTGLPWTENDEGDNEVTKTELSANAGAVYGAWVELSPIVNQEGDENNDVIMDISAFRMYFGTDTTYNPVGIALLATDTPEEEGPYMRTGANGSWSLVKSWTNLHGVIEPGQYHTFQLDTKISTKFVRIVTLQIQPGNDRVKTYDLAFYHQTSSHTYDETMNGGALVLPIEKTSDNSKEVYVVGETTKLNAGEGGDLYAWSNGLEDLYSGNNITVTPIPHDDHDTSVPEEIINNYQSTLLSSTAAAGKIKSIETSSAGTESVIQLEDGYRFFSKPYIYEPDTYGEQHIFRMDQAGTSCTLDSWGFASRGIHFERLDAEAVRSLSQAERDALPSVRVSDPETGSTQLAVRLVEVEKSASTVNIEFFMGYGMEVDVEILRDYLYKTQGYDGDLFLDYTIQVQFHKPTVGLNDYLLHVPPTGGEKYVDVDKDAKTITFNVRASSKSTKLTSENDNAELTLGDVHKLLSGYRTAVVSEMAPGSVVTPTGPDITDNNDATILSGGGGDVWFESAHTFSHGGAAVTLPCRYWEPKQVELLNNACNVLETNCRTKMIPKDDSKNRLRFRMTEDSSFLVGLQDYFTDAGAATTVAEFAFYGEIAVTAGDNANSSHLSDGTQYLSLVLSDLNMLKLDKSVTARLGEFLYAHHTETYHGKRPIYDAGDARFPLYGDSGISAFEEASRDLTDLNCPRDFVVRAYRHDIATHGIDQHLIQYDRNYLKKSGADDDVSSMTSLPLVFDADQRVVPQETFGQRVL